MGLKFLISVVLFGLCGNLYAAEVCNFQNPQRVEVCYKMRNLQASIQVVESQRELMQANVPLYKAAGNSLMSTARETLKIIGPGIPEHQMGLSGVARQGESIVQMADKKDMDLLVVGNIVRNNCAKCHAEENPPGGVSWDDIFSMDWQRISMACSAEGKNPYLCKSMNGMLSSYGFLLSAGAANSRDFEMAEQSSLEIARILKDLGDRGFRHLPEELRARAEKDARELAVLAAAKDESVFKKAVAVADTCKKCHEDKGVSEVGGRSFEKLLNLKTWAFRTK